LHLVHCFTPTCKAFAHNTILTLFRYGHVMSSTYKLVNNLMQGCWPSTNQKMCIVTSSNPRNGWSSIVQWMLSKSFCILSTFSTMIVCQTTTSSCVGQEFGMDMMTLLFHTLHAFQPLDVFSLEKNFHL